MMAEYLKRDDCMGHVGDSAETVVETEVHYAVGDRKERVRS